MVETLGTLKSEPAMRIPALLIYVFLALWHAPARANTFQVGNCEVSPAPYTSIAAALADAQTGHGKPHTIRVCPGTYTETNLSLSHQNHTGLTLTSTTGKAADVTIRLAASAALWSPLIYVSQSNVTLQGITFSGYYKQALVVDSGGGGGATGFSLVSSSVSSGDSTVELHADNPHLTNVSISSSGSWVGALYLNGAGGLVMDGTNTITNTGNYGYGIWGSTATPANPNISGTTITAPYYGLLLQAAGTVNLSNSVINTSGGGVNIGGGSGDHVFNNLTVTGNSALTNAFALSGGSSATFTDVDIALNGTYNSYATALTISNITGPVSIGTSAKSTVSYSSSASVTSGIYICAASGSTSAVSIANANVTSGLAGIQLGSSGCGNHTANFSNLSVTGSNGHGITIGNGAGSHKFNNITSTGTAPNGYGIALSGGAGATFTDVDATVTGSNGNYSAALSISGISGGTVSIGTSKKTTVNYTATTSTLYGVSVCGSSSAKLNISNAIINAANAGLNVAGGCSNGAVTLNNLTVNSSAGSAVVVNASGAHSFNKITAKGAQHGIYVNGGSNAVYANLNATGGSTGNQQWYAGLYLGYQSNGTLTGNNTLSAQASNDYGITLDGCSGCTLSGATIDMGNIAGTYGIYTTNSSNNVLIQGNYIKNANYSGMRLGSSNPTVTGNIVENAGSGCSWCYGIYLNYGSGTVYGNCLYNDSSSAKRNGESDGGAFYKGSTGNFWGSTPKGSGYSDSCSDANGDGVCDSRYNFYGNYYDNAPLKVCPVSLNNGVSLPAPLLEYRMDESGWSGTAGEVSDTSGKDSGTAQGAATTMTSGMVCRAGKFTTASSYVNLGHPNLGLSGQFTISTWINWQIPPANGNGWSNLFTYNSTSAGDSGSFWLQHSSDNSLFEFAVSTNNGRQYVQSSAKTVQNTWQHVVGVYDGANIYLYVNGILSGSRSQTGTVATPPADAVLTLGRWANSGSNYRQFNGFMDEAKLYNQALSASQVAMLYANEASGNNADGSARNCSGAATLSAMNAVDTGASASAGRITTKTAGTGFSLDVYALNATKSAQDSSFSGSVLVDLLANTAAGVALDSQNCPVSSTTLAVGNVSLSSGKGAVTVPAPSDAWRDVRVRLRYPATGTPTVTACSSDNFAVKPAYLAVQASDANWTSAGSGRNLGGTSGAGGGVTHKAGQPFSLVITGYNSANLITGNYDGTPMAGTISPLSPASVAGSLSLGSTGTSGGSIASTTVTFSEAGSFSTQFQDTNFAAVDAADTAATCAGYYVCSTNVTLGRFVPDHLTLTSATATPACGSFTYFGQDGLSTRFTLTAQNAANATTQNYAGALAPLDLTNYDNFHFSATGLPGGVTLASGGTAPSGTWVAGTATGVTATHLISRPTSGTPLSPASVALNAAPTDQDNVTAASGPPFASTPLRFGRLRLGNASGSELLDLSLPIAGEYWNGTAFATNTLDACTPLTPPTSGNGLVFYAPPITAKNALTASNTAATAGATLVAGTGQLKLAKPGATHSGYVDIRLPAPSWLQYNWQGCLGQTANGLFDDKPCARATFGVYKSGAVIYMRENY